jgi:hypothetical protein
LGDLFVVLFAVVCQANFIGHANTFEIFDEIAEVNIPGDEIAIRIQTAQLFGLVVQVAPDQGNRRPEGFQDEAIGVVPYSNGMFSIMHHQLFVAVREEPLYFRRFIDFDVPQKHFVLDIPNFKFFSCMRNQQMRRKRNLENVIVNYEGAGFDHKELLSGLNAMESDRSFVAVPDASIPIVV